ncbi:MAG: VOC family protein [Eubacteriales bacterium]|nr:VOC family protein [Eubacteriales bacterium]
MKELIRGLHHIGLPTSCMDETIAFYQSFGATVKFQKTDVYEGKPIRVTLLQWLDVVVECYERSETAQAPGAFDHLAFQTQNIEEMYRVCKEKGYNFMEDCASQLGESSYWPTNTRWFILIGPNGEKIEFCQE